MSSVLQSSFGGSVLIANNLTVNAPGIITGDGSGITGISLSGLSSTPGSYILADPTSGSLVPSSAINQDVSGNVTINAPILNLQGGPVNFDGPVVLGSMTSQVMSLVTADATPQIMFSQIIPAIAQGTTKLLKFYITANDLAATGNGAIYEGELKAFSPAISGPLVLSAYVVLNNVVDPAFAAITFTITSVGANQFDVTVTGLVATTIAWNGIMNTY